MDFSYTVPLQRRTSGITRLSPYVPPYLRILPLNALHICFDSERARVTMMVYLHNVIMTNSSDSGISVALDFVLGGHFFHITNTYIPSRALCLKPKIGVLLNRRVHYRFQISEIVDGIINIIIIYTYFIICLSYSWINKFWYFIHISCQTIYYEDNSYIFLFEKHIKLGIQKVGIDLKIISTSNMNVQFVQSQQSMNTSGQKMENDKQINIYKQHIIDGELQISNNKLLDLSFIDTMGVHKLELNGSKSVVPDIKSQTVKELIIEGINIENFNNIILENLETLKIYNCFYIKQCQYFSQVRKLELFRIQNLQQLISKLICKNVQELIITNGELTSLDALNIENVEILHLLDSGITYSLTKHQPKLNIKNITTYKHLRELNIQLYDNIDTTPLQQLKNLTIVKFDKCDKMIINFQNETITQIHLNCCKFKKVYQFKLQNIEIVNISQFNLLNQFLKNNIINQNQKYLKDLDLSNNEMIDLTLLQKLPHILILNLSQCKLRDFSAVSVNKNQYIDISPLKYLVQIEILLLRCCGINMINTLSYLVNLKELDLAGNEYIDLDHLKTLVKLTKLNLENCTLTNIDSLKLLINLEELNLSKKLCNEFFDEDNETKIDTNQCDLAPVQFLNKLTILNLNQCGKLKLSYLSTLRNLQQLYVSGTEIEDITALQYLKTLTILDLSNCQLSNIDSLKYLVNLKILNLNQNSNINITPLQYLTQLTKLELQQCSLQSIEALIPLQNLQQLYLQFNQIIYLNPLLQLQKLVTLHIFGNKVTDFDKFTKYFDLDSDQIKSRQHPTVLEIQQAIIMRNIHAPVTSLNCMSQKLKQMKNSIQAMYNHVNKLMNQQVVSLVSVSEKVVEQYQHQICCVSQ
ncbi:Conserved_hypothetical protein [Hexamita inflata]|uniref:Uncharacterized protein n=1 Tax=Hexamita inflata TaxID=28002 RepID=A0AA86P661_9EUKA|nr:Conserved hypothetical protein [Hexamita inflata]